VCDGVCAPVWQSQMLHLAKLLQNMQLGKSRANREISKSQQQEPTELPT
jgi:hypothetical protein